MASRSCGAELPALIGMLAELRTPDGRALDLTLTTNGAALRSLGRAARGCGPAPGDGQPGLARRRGLRRDERRRLPVAQVLEGIDAALAAGLGPVKVNMVVRRGINERSILPMARWARDTGVTLRFIEYMDVGHSNGWRLGEVVPAGELVDASPGLAGRTGRARLSRRGRRPLALFDGRGEFGVISSVTRPFCRDCTRTRLSADGKLYTCLFASPVSMPGPSSATARPTRRSSSSWRRPGACATTAIPSFGRSRHPICQRSRCSRWAAEDRARPHGYPHLDHSLANPWTASAQSVRSSWISALTQG